MGAANIVLTKMSASAATIGKSNETVLLTGRLFAGVTHCVKGGRSSFYPAANDELKVALRPRVYARFEYLADALVGREYLLQERFTIADTYAYYVLRHRNRYAGIPAKKLSVLDEFIRCIESRASVKAALSAEHLPGALDAQT